MGPVASFIVLRGSCLLLDNDGVLVDSAPSIKAAFVRWSDHFGLNGEEIYRTLHGRRAIEVATAAITVHRLDADPRDAARLLDQFELEDAKNVRSLPGSAQFLEPLQGAWTVVSSGPRALVEARLAAAGLPSPAHFVTADDVTHGKPHPESYLRGAALNRTAPAKCIAFEDSTTGLYAATAAGCHVVQVSDASPRFETAPYAPHLGSLNVSVVDGDFQITLKADV